VQVDYLPVETYYQALCYLAAGPVVIPGGKGTRECTSLLNYTEFTAQRNPPEALIKDLLERQDENRRATHIVPKVSARYNRTGPPLCINVPV
jgi:hypothetical protein